MEQILNFINELKPLQVILISIGVVILFPYLTSLFKNKKDVDNGVVEPDENEVDPTLTCLVDKWETLYNCCKHNGLAEVCEKLEAIFPMFLQMNSEHGCCLQKRKAFKDHDCSSKNWLVKSDSKEQDLSEQALKWPLS